MWSHIKSFETKLKLLRSHTEINELSHFSAYISLNRQKFSFLTVKFIEDTFNMDINEVPVDLQIEIIELQPQDTLKNAFKLSPSLCFAELSSEFAKLKKIAAKYLDMFGSKYIREQAFSHIKKLKIHSGYD
ncbi:uncharacterized protein LOC112596443 [Melanaphis sacchari]|uniref:uncharacterized protein LOC112596443 n=1 Tax=Melanaphis sacchari TaxID=742174 RepID=UPI000DC144C9|nr:uncharacterized protein LOC112596443 [Melanaphis sacchari]